MNIDDFYLSDEELSRLSRQVPSTKIGKELFPKWKERFVDPQPSEFYRGYAIVLWMLWKNMPDRITIAGIERIIDQVHDLRMASKLFLRGTDLDAGATIAASNAWEATRSGVKSGEIPGAYEFELIYTAGLFVEARSREHKTTADSPAHERATTQTAENVRQTRTPETVRQTRRRIAAAISGIIGLFTYSEHPYIAFIFFAGAAFFFFAKQSADQLLDQVLSAPPNPSSPDKPRS